MRQRLVGSWLGAQLLQWRDWWELKSLPLHNPEQAGTIANHILADRLIARLAPKGGTFLDVGAHIGSVFSAARRVDPALRVFAVEADPDKAASLRAQFPYATLFECAVGAEAGQATFYINPSETGYNSLVPGEGRKIEVEIRPIDALLPAETVDVIKMDIEGAELAGLQGASGLIARSRPVILFESADGIERNALGFAPGDVFDWCVEAGFEVVLPERLAHTSPALDRGGFLDAHHFPRRSTDFFAVPSERRDEIRSRARRILGIPDL